MAKKASALSNEQMVQPFQTRDALAQYVLRAMEERTKEDETRRINKPFSKHPFRSALHLHLAEMAPGDRITV